MLNISSDRKKENSKFTFIVVPGSKTEVAKSYQIGKAGLISFVAILFLIISLITLLLIIYTPLNRLIPISNQELENKYGKQIAQVEEKLNGLIQEIVVLRQYNYRLRQTLGENINSSDTSTLSDFNLPYNGNLLKPSESPEIEIEDFNSRSESFKKVLGKVSVPRSLNQIELPLIKPTTGLITQEFNPENGHLGIDIAAKAGTLVVAPAPGTVIFSEWTYDYGNTLIIAHTSGYRTVYKHTQHLLKVTGERVRRGEPIALVGNTGKETSGPHLHFELWHDGIALNPQDFLLNINN